MSTNNGDSWIVQSWNSYRVRIHTQWAVSGDGNFMYSLYYNNEYQQKLFVSNFTAKATTYIINIPGMYVDAFAVSYNGSFIIGVSYTYSDISYIYTSSTYGKNWVKSTLEVMLSDAVSIVCSETGIIY